MKIIKSLFLVFLIMLIVIAAILYTLPVWINHNYARQFLKTYLETYVNRINPEFAVTLKDYNTDVVSSTRFDNITLKHKSFKGLTLKIDKMVFRHRLNDLLNREIYGRINSGSSVIDFEFIQDKKVGWKEVSFKTNWLDAQELNYTVLRKLNKKIFNNISFNGYIRIIGNIKNDSGGVYAEGEIKFKDLTVNFRELGIVIDRLNGYMPFHEDFKGIPHKGAKIGRLEAPEAFYGKLKAVDLNCYVIYDNLGINLDSLKCKVFGADVNGKGGFYIRDKVLLYDLEGTFKRLDFKDLDDVVDNPDFGATGYGSGSFALAGKSSRIGVMSFDLGALEPGGTIRSSALSKILSYMPQGDLRTKVDLVLDQENDFEFTKAELRFEKTRGKYQAYLFVDGAHLLEFTINIDEEVIKDLLDLIQ